MGEKTIGAIIISGHVQGLGLIRALGVVHERNIHHS